MTAWSFDRAVQTYGGALERAIHNATEKAKNKSSAQKKSQQVLDKWLSSADTKAAPGRYRDPMASNKVNG